MPPSRQSKFAPRRPRAAFTLIELIFVLALLAICATFVAASLGSFFRGRALNFEARRLLSLTHYGHTRAVSEGVPVVLWISAKDSTYGLTEAERRNPDISFDAYLEWCAAQPSSLEETLELLRVGRYHPMHGRLPA